MSLQEIVNAYLSANPMTADDYLYIKRLYHAACAANSDQLQIDHVYADTMAHNRTTAQFHTAKLIGLTPDKLIKK